MRRASCRSGSGAAGREQVYKGGVQERQTGRKRRVSSCDGDGEELRHLVLGQTCGKGGGATGGQRGRRNDWTATAWRRTVLGSLATEARLLDAAEGDARLRDEAGVDADHAALDRLADAEGPAEVLGEEVCRSRSER